MNNLIASAQLGIGMLRHGLSGLLFGDEKNGHEPAGASDATPLPDQRPLPEEIWLHAHQVEAGHVAIRIDPVQMHVVPHGLSLEIVAKLTS